jgi:hypothetical protein
VSRSLQRLLPDLPVDADPHNRIRGHRANCSIFEDYSGYMLGSVHKAVGPRVSSCAFTLSAFGAQRETWPSNSLKFLNKAVYFGLRPGVAMIPEIEQRILVVRPSR